MRCVTHCLGAVVGLALGGQGTVEAQALAMADRAPRFLLSAPSGPTPVDVSRTAVLRRRIALELRDVTLGEALRTIARRSGLQLGYSRKVVPAERVVRLVAEDITVAGALSEVLFDTGVDVLFERDGQAALVRRPIPPEQQTGTIVGAVTDRATGAPIVGATVTVQGTRFGASTGEDGRYRIADVAAGTYTVRARHIGHMPASRPVTVTSGLEAIADFKLERSAQELDELVTTGTVVPTAVRAVPSPVSVITREDVEVQRIRNIQDLLRRAIPTAVSWNSAVAPYTTSLSVRGASSLSGFVGQMKIFVDGIEVASPTRGAVDPSSIERIEVIRGPQAATIYGSDAIGGVVQIFTKRGDASTRPRVDAQSALGLLETPYAGQREALRQEYRGSFSGGAPHVTYGFGGSYARTGDYLPNGEMSAQSNTSAFGGLRFERGIITADLSARYYANSAPNTFNPELFQTGFAFYSRPNYQPTQTLNQTVGARVGIRPVPWLEHHLTIGVDRFSLDLVQARPRDTSPGDTLLTVFQDVQTKRSIGVTNSITGSLSSNATGAFTLGVDHYDLPTAQVSTGGALNTEGAIQTAPGQSIAANRTVTTNTGYFAQVQVGFRNALFVTGGVRAERNSSFGDDVGTPVSPRVGASYTHALEAVTLKVRGSYGTAIRPPAPGQRLATAGLGSRQLANPGLLPERQRGWDTGIDASFGTRGSLGVTYYDQIADDLIQVVFLPDPEQVTSQSQNVGRVRNFGVEIEGSLTLRFATLKGQYGYARSRIGRLAPGYTGDLQVGDQSQMTPKHTAGLSISVRPSAATTLSGGVTYVGGWNMIDWVGFFQCLGGTGPCAPTARERVIAYPGFAKLNLSISQDFGNNLTGFASADNLTNNYAYEAYNFTPVVGRTTTVGLQLRY